jgi:HAD superfamily hydrolase (TIGR01509 family)
MHLRAVLFDFDGVIADTENIHISAWERTFGLLGWKVPPEVCARAAEEDDRIFLADVFGQKGITGGDVEGWVRRKQALTVAMLADWPPLYPGLTNLVRELKDRVTLAVVTGTWRENVDTLLSAAGLAGAFTKIIAKEDVDAPKPDPQAYRLALQYLKIRPADAVALEDSPGGLASARGAGIRAIAVGHRRPPGEWAGDAPYIADLHAVRANLERITR